MFDPRMNLSNEVSMQLIEHFDKAVFRTCIPRNIRLAEAVDSSLNKTGDLFEAIRACHFERADRWETVFMFVYVTPWCLPVLRLCL